MTPPPLSPLRIPMVKTVSGGNDFLQLDHSDLPPVWRPGLGELVVRICDRNNGMGADGLVIRKRVSPGTYDFHIFNRDGREAELSGNGMAGCAAVLFTRHPGQKALTLLTAIGPRRVECRNREFPLVEMTVEIGPADFHNLRQFPFLETRRKSYTRDGIEFFPVSVGNPHAVCILPRSFPEKEMVPLGERLRNNPVFPEGINVEIVRPTEIENKWEARFVERGVGVTQSSSTGCAAVFAVLRQRRMVADWVELTTPGCAGIKINGTINAIKVENTTRIVYKGEYVSQV